MNSLSQDMADGRINWNTSGACHKHVTFALVTAETLSRSKPHELYISFAHYHNGNKISLISNELSTLSEAIKAIPVHAVKHMGEWRYTPLSFTPSTHRTGPWVCPWDYRKPWTTGYFFSASGIKPQPPPPIAQHAAYLLQRLSYPGSSINEDNILGLMRNKENSKQITKAAQAHSYGKGMPRWDKGLQ